MRHLGSNRSATDSDWRPALGIRHRAFWLSRRLLAVAVAAMLVATSCSDGSATSGCDSTEPTGPPETAEVSTVEASYVYFEEGERTVTMERDEVLFAQRGAVQVFHESLPQPTSKADGPVYTANLFEPADEKLTVRRRSRSWLEDARKLGRRAATLAVERREFVEETANRIASNPFLWRLETESEPVYLFGTMHAGVAADFDARAPEVREAFRESDTLLLEVDPEEASRHTMARAKRMMRTDGSLKKQLDDEQWKRLRDAVSDEYPPRVVDRLDPWFAVLAYTRSGVDTERTMDAHFLTQARVQEMRIGFLESPAEQTDAMAAAYGIDVLGGMLDYELSPEESVARLVRRYDEGRTDALVEAMFEKTPWMSEGSPVHEKLFVERNRKWMSTLEKHLDEGGLFVAAGVGHFVGPKSLTAMLEEAGYDVERID